MDRANVECELAIASALRDKTAVAGFSYQVALEKPPGETTARDPDQ